MLSPLSPRCPTRAVDILRNHSLGLDSKTVEYLLLIVVRTGFEPVIAFGIDDIRPIFM